MNLKAQRNIPAKNPVQPQTHGPVSKEREIGNRVEMEHTQDPTLAAKICNDHLHEDPAYYSKLMAAGLVDEPAAQALVAQRGNSAPHVETKPLVPAPLPPPQTTHFINAERKTAPLGTDAGCGIEHFGGQISKAINAAIPTGIAIVMNGGIREGGSTITEPNAGITSDQRGKPMVH